MVEAGREASVASRWRPGTLVARLLAAVNLAGKRVALGGCDASVLQPLSEDSKVDDALVQAPLAGLAQRELRGGGGPGRNRSIAAPRTWWRPRGRRCPPSRGRRTAADQRLGTGSRRSPAGQTVVDSRAAVVLAAATGAPKRKLLVTTVPFQVSSW